ncbi:beta-microseminoprotein-like [Festucalex cinctus]
MRTCLCVALLLCAVLSLTNGHCYPIAVEEDATHCLDPSDNQWHPIGTKWRNDDCMDCDCSGCCSVSGRPTGYSADCESVLDKTTCQYRVQRRDDPSIECPSFGAVGK